MTILEQAHDMASDIDEDFLSEFGNVDRLAEYIYVGLRAAFRAGQRAEQERSGIQPSLANLNTLVCEMCWANVDRLIQYRKENICVACMDALARAGVKR